MGVQTVGAVGSSFTGWGEAREGFDYLILIADTGTKIWQKAYAHPLQRTSHPVSHFVSNPQGRKQVTICVHFIDGERH